MKRWISRVTAACLLLGGLPTTFAGEWRAGRTVNDVPLESRERDSRFLEHRGQVRLCGELQSILMFVSEPSELVHWVPYTESAEKLPDVDGNVVYHVVTQAPWPYKPRDMIYALAVTFGEGEAQIRMDGLPDHIPAQPDMVRMKAAQGVWQFVEQAAGVDVRLQMWVDPGSGPRLLVNRRAATTVGRMLANLRDRFPCNP